MTTEKFKEASEIQGSIYIAERELNTLVNHNEPLEDGTLYVHCDDGESSIHVKLTEDITRAVVDLVKDLYTKHLAELNKQFGEL